VALSSGGGAGVRPAGVPGTAAATPPRRGAIRVVVTGTDPSPARGGIAFAMPGYLAALKAAGLFAAFVPTYRRQRLSDKWWPALRALWLVPRAVRRIRREGGIPVVYAHAGGGSSPFREGIVLAVARFAGALTLVQLHSVGIDAYVARPMLRFLLRVAVAPAHAVCGLTEYWRVRLVAAGLRQPVLVVPNPLPPEYEAIARRAAPRTPATKPAVVVLIVTRLVRAKGVELLVRAAEHLPPSFEVVVAGDGPERSRLEALAKACGLEGRVRFVGWIDGARKHAMLESADVFCLPTQYDSFGMGIVEAMCHGLPVVALRWGAIPDVVAEGTSALLIDDPDPVLLAQAIARLGDAALRTSLGEGGRRVALQRYGAAAVGQTLATQLAALPAMRRRVEAMAR